MRFCLWVASYRDPHIPPPMSPPPFIRDNADRRTATNQLQPTTLNQWT